MDADGTIDSNEVATALPKDVALLALAYALADKRAAFRQACREGSARLARALVALLGLDVEDAHADESRALLDACANGHLEVVAWLVGHFGPPPSGLSRAATRALQRGGASGFRAFAQWAAAAVDSTVAARALRHASVGGHLATARWLVGPEGQAPPAIKSPLLVGLPSDQREAAARGIAEAAHGILREVCHAGRLETAQWIAAYFTLTADEGPAGADAQREALIGACAGGRLAVAQWAAEAFAFSAEDFVRGSLLRSACADGPSDIARWMIAHYALPAEAVLAAAGEAREWRDHRAEEALRQLAAQAGGEGSPPPPAV